MFFHGLGPLGCIPSQRVKSNRGICLKQVNMWVQEFNSKVQKLVNNLNRHLPSAQITFADTYQSVMNLIENPTAYGKHFLTFFFPKKAINICREITMNLSFCPGFKVSNTSCCNVDTSIGGLCLPSSNVCKDRKEYVFWDAFHPSDAANEVLADHFFASLFANAPSPVPNPKIH